MMRPILVCLAVGLTIPSVSGAALAGEFNPQVNIGNSAPSWSELIGVDGKKHSSNDLKSHPAIVIAFTCNSCPYAVDVEDRLIAIYEKYHEKKVAFVAINVNKVEEDLLPAMKKKAMDKGFKFPYLYDESQQIAKDFGAIYTPEFYVLDDQQKIAYMGAFDDSPDGTAVTKQHVESAIEAVLAGKKPVITETVPIGCRVRYERKRRTRKAK